MTSPEGLQEGEEALVDKEELLWRQVHPKFLQDGVVSSIAFRPFPRDRGKLSVRRERFGAEASYLDHLGMGFESAGTWSINLGEILESGARAVDDSALPDQPEAHAYVDYRGMSKRQTEVAAKRLCAAANQRGRAYPP